MKRTLMFLITAVAVALGVASAPNVNAQQAIAGTLLTSAARTVTTNSVDISNVGNRGVHIIVDMSAFVSGTFTPTIQGKNPVTGVYYTICAGAAMSSVSVLVLKTYPGITTSSGVCADVIPKTWRISMVGAASPSATFSVGYFSVP